VTVSERSRLVREGLAALDRGDIAALETLFAADAQWLGVSGMGVDGSTPI
jgi:ketosteroid isomerase-like protein